MKNKRTVLEQYALLVKNRIKSIENLNALMLDGSSPELNSQLRMEKRSLCKLLTEKYYSKWLKAERRALISKYVKGARS